MLFFSSFSDFKIFQGLGNEELWRRLVSVIHTTTIFWGAAYLFRKSSATIASKVASEVEKGAFTYNSKIPAPLSLSSSLYIQNVQYVFARVSPSHSHRYRISFYTWKCLVGFPHCIILFEKYGHRERRIFAERLKSEYWIFKHVRCTRSFRPSIALKFYSLSCSWLNLFANWRKIPQMVWVARALFRMTGKLKRPMPKPERSIKMVVGWKLYYKWSSPAFVVILGHERRWVWLVKGSNDAIVTLLPKGGFHKKRKRDMFVQNGPLCKHCHFKKTNIFSADAALEEELGEDHFHTVLVMLLCFVFHLHMFYVRCWKILKHDDLGVLY